MSKKIVAVCGDPGGARALLPVLDNLLKDDQIKVEIFAYSASIDIFRHAEIPHTQIFENWIDKTIESKLQKIKPHLVFTATSMHEYEIEKKFIKASQNQSIPSLSLMDFWANYRKRFVDKNGDVVFPNKIAAMDDLACRQMEDEGFPKELLIPTGQPAFDHLFMKRYAFSEEKSRQVRRDIMLSNEGKLVLFFSQPIAQYYGKVGSQKNTLGFDEFEVLGSVIESIKRIEEHIAQPVTLLVFPHPTQELRTFKQFETEQVRIYSQNDDTTDWILDSDLVLGMTSTRLYEALLMGSQVVSLQPGTREPFHFPPHFSGRISNVYSYSCIASVIHEKLIQKNDFQQIDIPFVDGLSTQRVVNLIKEMLHY